MKLYGILVSYYPEYAHKALTKFEYILAQLNANYKIIIACGPQSPLSLRADTINYSNTHWEFSGWQEALHALETQHTIEPNDLIVFANDTFCMHRYFGAVDARAFIKAFQTLAARSNAAIAGDLCTRSDPIRLPEIAGNYWISTYLFALRYGTAQTIGGLYYSDSEINRIIIKITDTHIQFCDEVSESFAHYINAWMYPKDTENGWTKARTASVELKLGKIKAILNEKRLSLTLKKRNVEFIPVYQGHYHIYRLWRERWIKAKNRSVNWLNFAAKVR